MARLALDQELESLLQDMRSDPAAHTIESKRPEAGTKKTKKKSMGVDIKIGIGKKGTGHGDVGGRAAPPREILSEERESELRTRIAGDDVLWYVRHCTICASRSGLKNFRAMTPSNAKNTGTND